VCLPFICLDGTSSDVDPPFERLLETREMKDAWLAAIREAKTRLLADLRTLDTTEEHTMRRHRRRSLQAMPFTMTATEAAASAATTNPASPSLRPLRAGSITVRLASVDTSSTFTGGARPADGPSPSETVESFTAAVWVPDAEAERCMRCREAFGIWRRRHHCRMCGVVCCHPCSSKVRLWPQSLRYLSWLTASIPHSHTRAGRSD
jgi:hypothetical protein